MSPDPYPALISAFAAGYLFGFGLRLAVRLLYSVGDAAD